MMYVSHKFSGFFLLLLSFSPLAGECVILDDCGWCVSGSWYREWNIIIHVTSGSLLSMFGLALSLSSVVNCVCMVSAVKWRLSVDHRSLKKWFCNHNCRCIFYAIHSHTLIPMDKRCFFLSCLNPREVSPTNRAVCELISHK